MSDDVTITVRVNNQTAAGFRDINGQLRSMGDRFGSSAGDMRRASDDINRSLVDVRGTLLSLAPAVVPVAASLAPLVAQAGAAGVAVAAFGAALVPQIGAMKDAVTAQDKYSAAVGKYGQYSKQAIQAQQQASAALANLPQATQRAAAGYSNLRDQFHAFSDSTAKFTMQPVEHSFAVIGAILPKLTPMVQATGTQLDRLVKVAGGAVNSAGFDALSKKFTGFANQTLKNATDGAIHFIRVLSEGNAKGPISSFMDYARTQGPAVKELITNLAKAISTLLQGAAQAGPGMLTLVNAVAKLVAALPPSLVGNLLQVVAAFKLIKLAGAGVAAVGAGVQSLAAKIGTLRTASAAAGGGLAGLRGAFAALGTAAKATVIIAGIAAVVAVLTRLSASGKRAPDVDRMTTAIGNLGATGKVTGEALRVFGTNLDGLSKSVDRVAGKASGMDSFNDTMNKVFTLGMAKSNSMKDAEKNVDAIDKSLANLVKNGNAKLAAQALTDLQKAYAKQGGNPKTLTKELDDYKSALADQALEQKLTAQSMGLFGDAAQAASAKLDQQKASADGLRQSIQALNDVNRQGLGGMIAFQQSIADAAKAAKTNAGALSMTGGQLNLSSQKARDAASALQDLADKTDAAAASARESGSSWEQVNSIYSKGRSSLVKYAEQMGLSKSQAKALADQILQIPDKTARIKMNAEDATRDLNAFNSAVRKTPGSKSVTLKTLSGSAEQVLESFGYKVTHLQNGKVTVSAAAGGALGAIANVAAAIRALNGKTATTYVKTVRLGGNSMWSSKPMPGAATGGLIPRYASGGDVQAFPAGGYVQGPGSGTSDSIVALMGSGAVAAVSNTEYVVKAAAVRKYGVHMLDAINEGRLPVAHLASGGLSQGAKDARKQLSGSFGISSFGKIAGYHRTPFEHGLATPDSVDSLVSSLNDAASKIKAAFSGKTESNLLKHLNSTGKSLISYEKQLNKVTASLSTAKDKLNSLKDSASQLSSSVKSSLISSSDITKTASANSGSTVTLGSIRTGLSVSRDKVTAFANALKQLKTKGYSASIIQQVAEAGIDGGGLETAGALLSASASEVSSINSVQSQIASAAGSAGSTTADSVYGKAIADQTKVVKQLTDQQSKLQKSMDKLATSMEKLISKALGKKAAGGIVGAAASGGIRSGLTLVGEQGPELAELPVGSRVRSNPDTRRLLAAQTPWASMLNAPHRTATAAAAGAAPAAGGGQPLVIQVRIGEREFGELWVDAGRKAVRARGSIQATLLPPRSR
ncbi:phage tail protein [Streptomyces misionensis]|uniref:PspA/IM30 family protein n=1 Tax=Streptomyces misionensis TaxID=67331 RepID=UPI00342CBD46